MEIRDFRGWVDHPRRVHAMRVRHCTERATRDFFADLSFQETRTPLLVRSPGMEAHLMPVEILVRGSETRAFLPTSPEFSMKKLLAGGLPRIFQMAPAFRFEPTSPHHHPEFLMLEWYRADAELEEIQSDCERLLSKISSDLGTGNELVFQGTRIDLSPPWPRFRTEELFRKAGVELVRGGAWATPGNLTEDCARLGIQASAEEPWDDLYFKIWLNRVETLLPKDRPSFVTHYPESQCALAELEEDPRGVRFARRFELYIGGMELANAFQELRDALEQRERFAKEMEVRRAAYGSSLPESPVDEEFLAALDSGLPRAAGIALGMDRMVQLFADEPEILFTLWLPSFLPGTEAAKA